jgi:DNA-binding CsgD family transcriptional regulator
MTPAVTARELAKAFSSFKVLGVIERRVYNEILRLTLETHPEYWGVWSVWKPNALDGRDQDYANQDGHDATGRYAPLWNRSGNGYRLEPNVGYDVPGLGDYFLVPVAQQKEVVFAPYEYRPLDGQPRVITSQVAPIFHRGECVGVAGFDIMVQSESPIPIGHRLRYYSADDQASGARQGLTPRERDVLTWLSEGKSNGEIAMILQISAHTVKHHVEKIFAKLGVENRQSAMRFAMERFMYRDQAPSLERGTFAVA